VDPFRIAAIRLNERSQIVIHMSYITVLGQSTIELKIIKSKQSFRIHNLATHNFHKLTNHIQETFNQTQMEMASLTELTDVIAFWGHGQCDSYRSK